MPDPRDRQLLKLCVARGLFDQVTADRIYQEALLQECRASDLLARHRLLSRDVVDDLLASLTRNEHPETIGGLNITRVIGRGGMATVYLAEEPTSHRQVAVKLMHPAVATHPNAVSRFLREAKVLSTIRHPQVVSVYGSGRHGTQPFLILELVAGGDAGQLVNRSGGRLDETRAVATIIDGCLGLGALHETRLLHRDIKPSNLLITAEGRAKLGDFGLARTQDDSDRLTTTGLTVGTPTYMSPEQAGGERMLDVRSDLYALGATLFALVTGQPPFSGKSPVSIAAKVLRDPFPDARVIIPALSQAVCRVITRATARHPDDRYQSPEEMISALRQTGTR